jgi:putative transposase
MIDRGHDLPLVRQAELLRLSRSTLYYEPRPVPVAELAIMRRIDELHLDYPFAGSRMLRDLLRGEGIAIGRELVATMMRRMRIEALYRRPNTSKPADGHKIYPYLLRGLAVERPNQVWAMDITYIPMARGFVYLAAVVDWFSRRVLAWRLSITLEVDFCLEAVEEALVRHGRPEIFNTDQGSQFTSVAFTDLLLDNAIAISMDGRGAWRDNVFVERLWRSVKYEEVYLRAMRQCWRGSCLARSLSGLLQSQATAFEPCCPDAGSCLLRLPAVARGSMNFAAVVGASLRSGYALPA